MSSPLALALVVMLELVLALQNLQSPCPALPGTVAPWSALLLCSPVAGGALLLSGAIGPTVLQPPVKNCFVVFRGCSIQL